MRGSAAGTPPPNDLFLCKTALLHGQFSSPPLYRHLCILHNGMRRQAAVYSGRVELAGKYIETGLRARRMRACPRLAGERSPRTVIRRSLLQEQLQTFLTLLNGVSSHRVPHQIQVLPYGRRCSRRIVRTSRSDRLQVSRLPRGRSSQSEDPSTGGI